MRVLEKDFSIDKILGKDIVLIRNVFSQGKKRTWKVLMNIKTLRLSCLSVLWWVWFGFFGEGEGMEGLVGHK